MLASHIANSGEYMVLNSINLVESSEASLAQAAREQLALRIGLSSEVLGGVIGLALPTLVASLAAACSSADGARAVLASALSESADARVGQSLVELCASTSGLKDLEHAGDALSVRATKRPLAPLSDYLAGRTGVPTQASYVIVAVANAVLLGCVKREVLLGQLDAAGLTMLMASQLDAVAPGIDATTARWIGLADHDDVVAQLAKHLIAAHTACKAATAIRPPAEMEPTPSAPVQVSTTALAPPLSVQSGEKTLRRRKRTRMAVFVLGVLALLAFVALGDSNISDQIFGKMSREFGANARAWWTTRQAATHPDSASRTFAGAVATPAAPTAASAMPAP